MADHVVDLVAAGVVQVLTLEVQVQAQVGAEVRAECHRRRTAHVVREHVEEFLAERIVRPGVTEGSLDLLARTDQRLRDKTTAVVAEKPERIRFRHLLTLH